MMSLLACSGHLPDLPGEGGPAQRVCRPALGDAQPHLVCLRSASCACCSARCRAACCCLHNVIAFAGSCPASPLDAEPHAVVCIMAVLSRVPALLPSSLLSPMLLSA
jgi:hypothetical protein